MRAGGTSRSSRTGAVTCAHPRMHALVGSVRAVCHGNGVPCRLTSNRPFSTSRFSSNWTRREGRVATGQSPRPSASARCGRRRRRAPGADRPRRRLRRARRPRPRTARRARRNPGYHPGHTRSAQAYSRPRGIAVAARTMPGPTHRQSSHASPFKRILKMSGEDRRARTLAPSARGMPVVHAAASHG